MGAARHLVALWPLFDDAGLRDLRHQLHELLRLLDAVFPGSGAEALAVDMGLQLPVRLVHDVDLAAAVLGHEALLAPLLQDLRSCIAVALLLLDLLEALLQLPDLLGLAVEALLAEALLLTRFGNLGLGPSALRARLHEVVALALGS